ncbi:MAG TPA: ORF6C domain-containing protein [Candidatus Desulfovibrio intestinigallinarum]|nr:ORF6C domain-containing protein [Candidatus Desulfovibrio intestinigallinarum]
MEMALTFNDVTLTPISHQNSLWIRAAELARALGYGRENQVSRLYRSNADEFTPEMTQVIEISDGPESGLSIRSRIFSLRGCHLLAMFARTPVAKAFRRWVLDVLEKYAAEQQSSRPLAEDMVLPPADAPISPSDQSILQSVVKAKIASLPEEQRGKGLFPQIWSRFNNHFRLGSYKQLPQCRMAEAVTYLMGLELPADRKEELPPPLPQDLSRDSSPRADALRRVANLRWGMASAIDVLRLFCDPRYHPHQYDRMSQEVAINLYRTAHGSLVAAYNALEAAHRLQHAVLPSVERS